MGNKLISVAAVAVALGLFFGFGDGCKKKAAVDESKVIARVGDAVLTVDELARLDDQQKNLPSVQRRTKTELMDAWVQSEVVYQKALKDKLDQEKETAWRLYNVRKAILIQRFWETNVYEKYAEATEADARAYYEKVKDKQYRTQTEAVWVRRAMFNTREAAEDVLRRVKAGADFADIVGKESASPDKLEKGSLGYRRLQDLSASYQKEIAKAKPGDIVGPIRAGSYWILLKLEDRVPPGGYLKPEGLGIKQLQDKAKVARWLEESDRIGAEITAATKIERHPERIPMTGSGMVPEGPANRPAGKAGTAAPQKK
jgi:parvulin-like peptidyl-prolyl isomerase